MDKDSITREEINAWIEASEKVATNLIMINASLLQIVSTQTEISKRLANGMPKEIADAIVERIASDSKRLDNIESDSRFTKWTIGAVGGLVIVLEFLMRFFRAGSR